MVNHSYKYTPVIQLLEIHSFSSQHGDVNMKLYPCSNEPGQEVTIAGYSGSDQSRSWSECPHMLPARFSCGHCRSVLAWWHCDTGLWRVKHQPTLWWTPSHRTFKVACDGHRPSPVLTVWFFLQKNYLFSSFKQHCWQPADTAPTLFKCPKSFHPHLTVWWKMSFHQVSVNLSGEWAGVWYFDTQKLQTGKQNQG